MKRPSRPSAAPRRGFTLVEVLAALAILGMVLGSVGIVFHAGIGSWRAAAEMAEESHDAEAVMEQIAMALRSAYYPANGKPEPDYGFQHEDGGEGAGARDRISWVKIGSSLVGEDVPWAGAAHRVNLFVSDGEDGQDAGLYVSAWQIVGQSEDFDPEEDVAPVLLSDQVEGLDVRMQDPTRTFGPDEPFDWLDEWESSNCIPDHVFVQLSMKPRGRGAEPDVLVRMVRIPMSEVSWNPAKPGGGGGRDRDRGRMRKGDAGYTHTGADPSARPDDAPRGASGSWRRGGGPFRPGAPGAPGRSGGGSAAPGVSGATFEDGRFRVRTGGGK